MLSRPSFMAYFKNSSVAVANNRITAIFAANRMSSSALLRRRATLAVNNERRYREVVTFADDEDASGGSMKDQKVVFTGFRDKALAAEVEAQGGTMQSGVSGKTTILVASNPNSNSGKMKKAREKGIPMRKVRENVSAGRSF